MSDSSSPLPAADAPRPSVLPDVVVELQHSVTELELAAKAFSAKKGTTKEARNSARKLAEHAAELVAAVVAACNERPGALHVLAVSHLTVFKDTVNESVALIRTRLAMSWLDSIASGSSTAGLIQTWSLGITELGVMLRIDKGVAQLVLDPARWLELSNAEPEIDLSKLNPSTSKVVYDGFKIVLEGMVNMTDGAPWPWKAIPQIILQFAKLVERSLDLPDKVHDLIQKISQRIAILFNVRKEDANPHQSELTSFVEVFFADMQRIIIRLRIVEKTHPVKVFPLTDRINAILEDESARMQEALLRLQTRFLAHTAYTVESISACVTRIQSTMDTTLTVATETRTEVQFVSHVVQETAVGVDTIRTTTDAVHKNIGAVHEGMEATHAAVIEIRDEVKMFSREKQPTMAKLPARSNIFNGRDESVNAIVTLICAGLCACIAIMASGGIRSNLSRHASEGFRVPSIIDSTCVRRIQSTVGTTRAEVQPVSHVVQETAVGVDTIRTTTDAVHKDIGAVHEGVGAAHGVVTEIRDEVKMMSREKQPTISNRAKLPARPTFFYGRDDSVNIIVELICASTGARIAIMGSGGIGKTSLSLAVIYDERVVGVIGDSGYFVSVESATDVGAAAHLLAGQLGLPESSDPLSASITHLKTIPRVLLIVDNLETLLFSKNAAARKDTERMLQRLAGIPSLTLIITSRGAVPPNGIRWSNAPSAGLEAISLGAARETFEQIAGRPELAHECDALDSLLVNVDCMPLAVTLLAQMARLGNSPSHLLQRWQLKKTSFIRSGGDDRESSVDVSIQISLDLLEGMRNGMEGQQLLSICANLPDGLRPTVFDKLDVQFSDIHGARDLLVEFALISIGPENELKMLSPVRHFVLKHHAMAINHAAALRKIYFDIAASGPTRMDENFSLLAQNVAPEYDNLTSFLLHLINIEEPSQEFFDAIHAVSEYAYWTVPSTTLREAFCQRLDAHPVWLAPCLEYLARTQLSRDEYALAEVNLHAARKLYITLDNKFREAVCGRLLGKCLRLQGSLEAAERELLAAQNTFIELGYEGSAAQCAQQLGGICRSRDEYDQAKIHLTSARDVFKRCGDRFSVAQCTARLGTIQLLLGNFAEADAEFQYALAEFEALADPTGRADCMHRLGDLRVRQNDYDSAETLFATAREVFTRTGERAGLALCHSSLGHLRHAQGRLVDAMKNFLIAEEILTAIGDQKSATECREMIAKLRDSQ